MGCSVYGQHFSRGVSQYRGVIWNKQQAQWTVQFDVSHGTWCCLGPCPTEQEAAAVHDAGAYMVYGRSGDHAHNASNTSAHCARTPKHTNTCAQYMVNGRRCLAHTQTHTCADSQHHDVFGPAQMLMHVPASVYMHMLASA